jgi:hypothetical protein
MQIFVQAIGPGQLENNRNENNALRITGLRIITGEGGKRTTQLSIARYTLY